MQGQASSRKRITFNYPAEIIRLVFLVCLLASIASFAANGESSLWSGGATPQAQTLRPAESSAGRNSGSGPRALANLQPLSESASIRLLWLAAALALILVLRCQRRKA
jgi:hypothetical protein